MQFWLESAHGLSERYQPSAQALRSISSLPIRPSTVKVYLDLSTLQEEELINFIALCQKSWKHLSYTLGYQIAAPMRPKIWQRYRKNLVNRDHAEDIPVQTLMEVYVRANFQRLRLDGAGIFVFECEAQSATMVAALVGRLVNMARWCVVHTVSLKLISDSLLTWKAFEAISIMGEQPLIRGQRRL